MIKIISCNCFNKMEELFNKKDRNLLIEEIQVTEDMNLEAGAPYIYLKSGKDNIKKKEFTPLKAAYCPVCGTKILAIETEDVESITTCGCFSKEKKSEHSN